MMVFVSSVWFGLHKSYVGLERINEFQSCLDDILETKVKRMHRPGTEAIRTQIQHSKPKMGNTGN